MTSEQLEAALDRYAEVIVRVGLNLQPGQRLQIRSDLQGAPLLRRVARSAYQAGARLVDVHWGDEQLSLVRLQHAPRDSFTEYPEWTVSSAVTHIDRGDALLSLLATTPNLLDGQDPALISTMMQTASRQTTPVSERIQRNAINWTVAAAATPGWAAQVFPDLSAVDGEAQLWDAILRACRIDQGDPVTAWRNHIDDLAARCAYLNAKHYSALHYRAAGTDLRVGLADGHDWVGGTSVAQNGILFAPNLPTEEVFTLPHRKRVEGVVRASRPLSYGGTLITDFSLRFAAGRVVEVTAARGAEVLQRLVDTDEGAAHLGEVALVPHSSPISRAGIVFNNTLFDENAASHFALGRGYRFCTQGGESMSDEEFGSVGGNTSMIHVDYMVGSADMDIDGITADGSSEPLMHAGEWAFAV